ncbi:MAG: NAD(P)H-binding protein [bacterium]
MAKRISRKTPKASKSPRRKATRKAPSKPKTPLRRKAKPVKAAKARRAKPKAKPAPGASAARAPAKPARATKAAGVDVVFKERAAPVAFSGRAAAEARPLKIVLFGASGNIGSRITSEAVRRGHHVTAVMRNPDRMEFRHANVRTLRADVTDPILVATVARGHDAIISAIAPADDDHDMLAEAASSILQAARETGIKRIVIANGAGSLLVGKGKMLMDTPQFPAEWRWIAKSHKDALDVLRAKGSDLDWTAVSPAAMIAPGKRTGKYRLGGDQLMADAKGDSRISMEDFAAALMDELEQERYVGKRMSVAY